MSSCWLYILIPAALLAQTPREIILRSAYRDQGSLELSKDYTFVTTSARKDFDSSGKVKSTESETHDVTILYGRPYERLISKDGKPLSAEEARKEQRNLDKELAKRAGESEKDRAKYAKEEAKRLQDFKDLIGEVADAYDFRLLGDELVDGHPSWVIEGNPRSGYKPRSRQGSILPKMRGKIWISQREYRWVKLEAEVIDTLSFGLFLFRLNPGTLITFEQTRVQDELWLPRRVWVRAHARVGLLKKMNAELTMTWDNYRKFQTNSRVVNFEGAREPATATAPRE